MFVTESGIEVEDFPSYKWIPSTFDIVIERKVFEKDLKQAHEVFEKDFKQAHEGKNQSTYFFFPRGSETSLSHWTMKSPPNYVERAHVLLGQTADTGKVRDIIAAFKYMHRENAGDRVMGTGQAGILAAYAALFEPSIKEVIIINPPRSHREGPYFLNVLRVLDIPEALGLLAPNVRLTLVNARDPAFDRTEQIYRLAGAADKFTRK